LPMVREHRVRRIAQQRDAPECPPVERIAVEQAPQRDPFSARDESLHHRIPSRVLSSEIVQTALRAPGFLRIDLGRVKGRDVEELTASYWVHEDVLAVTH